MDKALLVFDQVPFDVLAARLATRGLPPPDPVTLDYVPRTTPVGHATISTGHPPSKHRIQGRTWWDRSHARYDISEVTRRAPPRIFDFVQQNSLASRLRAGGTKGIMATAAKDFIPYLFGAWHSDLILFPTTIRPDRLSGGTLNDRIGYELVLESFTNEGATAARAGLPDLERHLAVLASTIAGSAHEIMPGRIAARTMLRWALPTTWGTTPAAVLNDWVRCIEQLADAVDDFYTRASLAALAHLPAPRALLQSCFATDAAGHRRGPSSPQYARSVERSIDRAQQLIAEGWRVAITSDHGGRDTPRWQTYDPATCSVEIDAVTHFLPPASRHGLNGDHAIGHSDMNGPVFHALDSSGLQPLPNVPRDILHRSFHPQQIPSWIVLPARDARFDARRGRGGGGDHGACHENGMISEVDNVVGVWAFPQVQPAPSPPRRLDEVAAWFLALR